MTRRLIFVLAGASLLAQPPRYTIHDLGPLTGPTDAAVTGINIRGQVVGYDTRPGGQIRSFRTAPNAAINWSTDDLGTLGGDTRARGVNASGQVVGESMLANGDVRGFRTAPNSAIQPAADNIGILSGSSSRALAINAVGQVTGLSGNAFVTAPNRPINPATDALTLPPNLLASSGRYINNQGHVLAEYRTTTLLYPTAFLYTRRTSAPILDVVRAPFQDFAGLTEQDQIIFNSDINLFVWQNGKRALLAKCAMPCTPTSVNNSLQIVGPARLNPFLYTDGVVYDINTLIPAGSGWTLSTSGIAFSGWFINDLGQIAGIGTLNNQFHAIRLDPVPSVPSAIDQTLRLLESFNLDRGRRSALPLTLETALTSWLNAALTSWNAGNPAATRGQLNAFETIVRSQAGQLLTNEEARQLIDLAEAAIALK